MTMLALVQMNSTQLVDRNFDTALLCVDQAIKNHAGLIVLPEHFLYIGPDKSVVFDLNAPQINILREIARKSKTCICAGSFLERNPEGGKPFNTSVFIDADGQITGIYRKIHLFDVEIHDSIECHESKYTAAGNKASLVKTPFATIGMTICYDLRFPELYRLLALRGCDLILVPSNFALQTGKDHWQVLLRARAIENGVYIAAANQFGTKYDGNSSYGRSAVIDPWGITVAQAEDTQPAVVLCEINSKRTSEVRSRIPSLKHIKLFQDHADGQY